MASGHSVAPDADTPPSEALPPDSVSISLRGMLPRNQREKLARETYSRAVKEARTTPTAFAWARLLRAAKNLHDALTEVGSLGTGQPNEC